MVRTGIQRKINLIICALIASASLVLGSASEKSDRTLNEDVENYILSLSQKAPPAKLYPFSVQVCGNSSSAAQELFINLTTMENVKMISEDEFKEHVDIFFNRILVNKEDPSSDPPYINFAVYKQVSQEYSLGAIRPEDQITEDNLEAVLKRMLGYLASNMKNLSDQGYKKPLRLHFEDIMSFPNYANNAIAMFLLHKVDSVILNYGSTRYLSYSPNYLYIADEVDVAHPDVEEYLRRNRGEQSEDLPVMIAEVESDTIAHLKLQRDTADGLFKYHVDKMQIRVGMFGWSSSECQYVLVPEKSFQVLFLKGVIEAGNVKIISENPKKVSVQAAIISLPLNPAKPTGIKIRELEIEAKLAIQRVVFAPDVQYIDGIQRRVKEACNNELRLANPQMNCRNEIVKPCNDISRLGSLTETDIMRRFATTIEVLKIKGILGPILIFENSIGYKIGSIDISGESNRACIYSKNFNGFIDSIFDAFPFENVLHIKINPRNLFEQIVETYCPDISEEEIRKDFVRHGFITQISQEIPDELVEMVFERSQRKIWPMAKYPAITQDDINNRAKEEQDEAADAVEEEYEDEQEEEEEQEGVEQKEQQEEQEEQEQEQQEEDYNDDEDMDDINYNDEEDYNGYEEMDDDDENGDGNDNLDDSDDKGDENAEEFEEMDDGDE